MCVREPKRRKDKNVVFFDFQIIIVRIESSKNEPTTSGSSARVCFQFNVTYSYSLQTDVWWCVCVSVVSVKTAKRCTE